MSCRFAPKIVTISRKSRGSYLYNSVNDQRLIDLYGFSAPK